MEQIKHGDHVEWITVHLGRKPTIRLRHGTVVNIVAGTASVKPPSNYLERVELQHLRPIPPDTVIDQRIAHQELRRRIFRFVPSAAYGVGDDTIHVYRGQRLLGYLDIGDVPTFLDGDNAVFKPVDNWRATFSIGLMTELGLSERTSP